MTSAKVAPPAWSGVLVRPVARPTRRSIPPLGLLLGIGLGAVCVLGLWWSNTPAVAGVAGWTTNAGRITGLMSGYGVIVLLGLMARVPAVEHGVGADRLARWHTMGGRYVVCLISAHALFVVWGYSLTDHSNVFSESVTLWTTYADVLQATVALGLFIGVGITSARAVRSRLRYETWHYIHFYTYLAIALAFSHQFSTGGEFVDNRRARLAWATLYIATTALLVWYRFLTPGRQALRHRLRVTGVVTEGRHVVSIWIAGHHLDELAVESGQFFRWRFITRSLWWASNPYSISAAPNADQMRITVKDSGDHSSLLRRLKPGTRVFAEGPYGAMTAARRTGRGVLLIAGGVGITPLRALFESLPADSGEITLIYRATASGDILFRNELDQIAEHRGARVIYSVGKRNSRDDVIQPGLLQQAVPDVAKRDVYLCGPSGLTDSARSALRNAGVPRRRIHTEQFEW